MEEKFKFMQMKIKCEMCGSTDLIKQDGSFVCQSCGLKYSVEEAKKMMVEVDRIVEPIDKVKNDNATKLDNLYQLARRARSNNDSVKATKYYEQILIENPNSWEAAYYSAYYTAMQQFRNDNIGSAIITIRNCIDTVFGLILCNSQDIEIQREAISEVTRETSQVCEFLLEATEKDWKDTSDYLVKKNKNGYNITNEAIENNQRLAARVVIISEIYNSLGVNLLEIFGDRCELGKEGISLIEEGIRLVDYRTKYGGMKNREKKEIIKSYKSRLLYLIEEAAKRRFNEYWANNESKKDSLESEKISLLGKIDALNDEIAAIPQNTNGYFDMVELQNQVQNLLAEKKAIGFFKFKDKRAVQVQIDSVNNEIAPIQLLINSAIDEVKERIIPLRKRIEAIDIELSMPR